ncbi:unnamed protein product [Owenia fusiformis]|uniref:Uncharacterized protein n=1 Tax=Owenia fusiformis TaxID=6347 RepID=A0A8J1TDS9_OWEFU|nr:unnamed protein product [Owenia fusiformis]
MLRLPPVMHQCIILLILAPTTIAFKNKNNQIKTVYRKDGDITIGAIFPIHLSTPDRQCSDKLLVFGRGAGAIEFVEAMEFVINKINRNDSILPNVTLGLVVLDDCFSPFSTYQALQIGRTHEVTPNPDEYDEMQGVRNITAVISGPTSSASMLITQMLEVFQVPTIGHASTSDQLSDKKRFPYFLRITPPDSFQAWAIVDIISYFNWTYVSVIYQDDDYGINLLKNIVRLTDERGICIANENPLTDHSTEDDIDKVFNNINDANVEIVIMVAFSTVIRTTFKQAISREMYGKVWILGDAGFKVFHNTGFEKIAASSIMVSLYSTIDEEFEEFQNNLTPANNQDNPWYPELWESYHGCQWVNSSTDSYCENYGSINYPITNNNIYSLTMDALNSVANGLNNLISKVCPEVFTNTEHLKTCLSDGARVLKYIQNVNFHGITGHIQFDRNGDGYLRYKVNQIQFNGPQYVLAEIGYWDRDEGLSLQVKEQWIDVENKTEIEIVSDAPRAICSEPCLKGQYMIKKTLHCCWDCHTCRGNEIVINNSKCEQCPDNQWPDQTTYEFCRPIIPEFLKLDDVISICLLFFASVGLFGCITALSLMVKYRKEKLIKASSRELLAVTLCGTILNFLTVFFIVAKPTTWSCVMYQNGFYLSGSLIYVPLLIKANRVFRIFSLSMKTTKKPRFVASKWQLIFCSILLGIQVILMLICGVLSRAKVTLRMPMALENYTELICHQPVRLFMVPLIYNILLILGCVYFGVKTRKLPDNFNESKFIVFSASTTFLIWCSFIPTYFLAFYSYQRVVLLSIALLLNGFVTLLCLYTPKLYAVVFVEEDKQMVHMVPQTSNPIQVQPINPDERSGNVLHPVGVYHLHPGNHTNRTMLSVSS